MKSFRKLLNDYDVQIMGTAALLSIAYFYWTVFQAL